MSTDIKRHNEPSHLTPPSYESETVIDSATSWFVISFRPIVLPSTHVVNDMYVCAGLLELKIINYRSRGGGRTC